MLIMTLYTQGGAPGANARETLPCHLPVCLERDSSSPTVAWPYRDASESRINVRLCKNTKRHMGKHIKGTTILTLKRPGMQPTVETRDTSTVMNLSSVSGRIFS